MPRPQRFVRSRGRDSLPSDQAYGRAAATCFGGIPGEGRGESSWSIIAADPLGDLATGRLCRNLTPEMIERLREYEKGNRAKRIDISEPTFFDSRTGEQIVWYYKNSSGTIQFFDLMGFHPETGEELLPVTKEIIDIWKVNKEQQKAEASRAPPNRIDPQKYAFFDPKTGEARVWYWRDEAGVWEFYDNRGFQPRTGDPLQVVSKDVIARWKQGIEALEAKRQEEQAKREQEQREQQKREEQKRLEAQEKEQKQKQAANQCDLLAANPNDLLRSGAGVPYNELKVHAKEAVDACTNAIAANPKELRFQYQLGRAMESVNRAKAFEILSSLVKAKYPAAYDNLGWLYYDDKKNVAQAVSNFRIGADLGDPDSMISLAEMIDRGAFVNPVNGPYGKLALLKRAADLGDQAGVRAYNEDLKSAYLRS